MPNVILHDWYFQLTPGSGIAIPLSWFITGWLGVLGAIIGSFLNVVIYRLPLGMSLSHPGSRCPVCRHAIRWYDNVPVLGWLWLRGRCRDCQAPISARYPAVEGFVGLLFSGLAWLEIFGGGVNLPADSALGDIGPSVAWLRYAYHISLGCTLLCAALIEYDGQPIPRRLWLPVFILGLAAPILCPELRPVPFDKSLATPILDFSNPLAGRHLWIGLVDGVCGLLVGAGLGFVIAPACRRTLADKRAIAPQCSAIPALALVGSFLGWQAVCWVASGGLLLYGLTTGLAFGFVRRVGFVFCTGLATCALLATWHWLDLMQSRVGWHPAVALPLVAASLGLAAHLLGRCRNPPA